ncbi:hypothetical protein KSP40_PGU010155 [Platanthera guangdongensis]|uniref:Uncharacterized protein n=1 Tax=Platanthera guangdongensis TaxID=2320717 RepID=A0ABR2MJG1_9ASPA
MAPIPGTERLLLLLFLFYGFLHLSAGSHLLRGSVACNDCSRFQDLSGVRLIVNCSKDGLPTYVLTNRKGQFKISIPKPSSSRCAATLLGGRTQLCAFKKSMVSDVVNVSYTKKLSNYSSYALRTPLSFYMFSCQKILARKRNEILNDGGAAVGEEKSPAGASSTPAMLPQPNPYGLPPLIYIFPFFPIIGIP